MLVSVDDPGTDCDKDRQYRHFRVFQEINTCNTPDSIQKHRGDEQSGERSAPVAAA
jgi:hypothetical protein